MGGWMDGWMATGPYVLFYNLQIYTKYFRLPYLYGDTSLQVEPDNTDNLLTHLL